jgi:hypothetical protein
MQNRGCPRIKINNNTLRASAYWKSQRENNRGGNDGRLANAHGFSNFPCISEANIDVQPIQDSILAGSNLVELIHHRIEYWFQAYGRRGPLVKAALVEIPLQQR